MKKYVNGHYIDMTAEEIKQQQALEQTENTQTLEEKFDELEKQITATQEALCEIYEQIV